MKTVYNILSVLFGAAMIIFGANKFFNFIPMPELTPHQAEIFGAFGKIGWLMPMVALAEILGGLLVLFPKTQAIGTLVLLPIILGIMAHHIHHDPAGLATGIGFGLVEVWILLVNRKKLAKLF